MTTTTDTDREAGLTFRQIENRLDYLEFQIAQADPKDLPAMNEAREKLLIDLTSLVEK